MKKVLCLCYCVVGFSLLTGCGGKTLKCTRENNIPDDQMKMSQELNISFNGDKASNLVFKMDVSFESELIENNPTIVDDLAGTASSEFDNIKDEKGISYSISKKSDGFSSKLKINFNKVDNETKKKIYLINHQSSYSTIKSNLEKDGYSCK
jgi:hypothetical protein